MDRPRYTAGRSTVGLVLRVFATKPELVEKRVAQVRAAVDAAYATKFFSRIDVFVWNDERYPDHDCGHTAAEARKVLGSTACVHDFKTGDLFCGLLNHAIALQMRHGCDYSVIASNDVHSYMTPETLGGMVEAAKQGARAIGVAIGELSESIREGRIANTLAMWHNVSLMQVGAFDLRAQRPVDDRTAHYMRGHDPECGEVYYHLGGVEETIPLLRLVDTFGECIAVVEPQGEGIQQYVVPDAVADPEGHKRHHAKMGTKWQRQNAHACSAGFDLSFLKGGLM